jgi:outer membrane protein assembly factor BamB
MNFASRVLTWHLTRSRLAVILMACAAFSVIAAVPEGTADAAGDSGPPPLTVLTRGANNGNGDIFLAPFGDSNYASGPEIVTPAGTVVWFHPLPTGDSVTDFRAQTYLGRPVLTWWQEDVGGGVIYNDHFQQIATVKAGNGYAMDVHEFLITPWNTALILADGVTTANLTSIGGPADQQVDVNVVQEIDIKTGRVLFQWNASEYVPYRDSHLPLPATASQPWDWFHINAVHLDVDGNLLISSRHTWTVYKVNRSTGRVMWELGGKQSSFTLKAGPRQVLDRAGEIFAWQHDPEGLGNGVYTFFDNEAGVQAPLLPYSRAVTVHLDIRTHVATLVKSDNQPEGLPVGFGGNVQTTRNGDLFVGWDAQPYISEFSPSGTLLFNAELPSGVLTYRAYRLPWPPLASPGLRWSARRTCADKDEARGWLVEQG